MHLNVVFAARLSSCSACMLAGKETMRDALKGKVLMKTEHYQVSSMQPGGVVAKHSGLWTRRREFESLPGYSFPIMKFMLYATNDRIWLHI